MKVKLGALTLENNLILGPLLNVTTGPYRRFCRSFFNIGLVCVPMLYTKRIVTEPNILEIELAKIEEERPISVQLIGSNPKDLVKSIDLLESYKFDVLDLNAGCPSKRAIKAKEGGFLLKNLSRLKIMLEKAVKHSSKPVSLKTRLGYDNLTNLNALADIINTSGIDFVTMHARLITDRFGESTLNLHALKKLKKKVTIPVVGNGDISNSQTALDYIENTKVNGLMIGRGSMGNPEIFAQIYNYLQKEMEETFHNTKKLMKKRITLYEKILKIYVEDLNLKYDKEEFIFIELKRNAIWLTKDIKNATIYRTIISNAKSLCDLKIRLSELLS
ncbi:MAG: hypothetical protein GF383_07210 [Candidatus Lokiarchaeota archaeon]|nr:hypothetical protein [Candidatus Lokiarchaeota archaeon]MBD3339956.1 hypothetical protein [Candidatus Lokiarchaeota archaeon]